MVDYCTTKQISTFIIALIGFSVLVFFIEEYTEENEMENEMEIKKNFYNNEHDSTTMNANSQTLVYNSKNCWKHEKTEIISKCLPCKDFEMNALKADHCTPTGFYDRLNCTKSNIIVLRPCTSPKEPRKREFYFFTLLNSILLAGSYYVANQRKTYLDSVAYNRLPTHF